MIHFYSRSKFSTEKKIPLKIGNRKNKFIEPTKNQIAMVESQKMTTKLYPQKDHILKSPEEKII